MGLHAFPAGKESPPLPHNTTEPFTLSTSAPTDIWRKPPHLDVFNAPIIYHALPVQSFKRARVSCTSTWKTLYDQGGLVLLLPPKKGSGQKRWVKTGIEFYQSKPCMSVVAADEWADWSLVPLAKEDEAAGRMTVEVEREQEKDGSLGSVLRIWLVGSSGVKFPIREITWAFHDCDESEEMWVGVFAAKPTKDDHGDLTVTFEGFEVETRK